MPETSFLDDKLPWPGHKIGYDPMPVGFLSDFDQYVRAPEFSSLWQLIAVIKFDIFRQPNDIKNPYRYRFHEFIS